MKQSFQPAGVSSEAAEKLTDQLQDRLVSLVDLTLVLKHVHWNVVGPGFIAVHEMIDDHVESVREMADEVAERIATLGAVPNALSGHIASTRSWDDYDLGRAIVPAHLAALDKVYDGVIADHRNAVEHSAKLDPVTEDLLIGQLRTLELCQWFVRAHITNTSGELMSGDATTELGAAAQAVIADPRH